MRNSLQLKVEDYICEDGQVYFIASRPCIIGKYDYQSCLLNVLFDYSQIVSVYRPFTRIVKYHYKIYCIPCYAENIYCYDLNSKQFYSLTIPDTVFHKMPNRKIIEAIEVKGHIYCISRSPHIVLIINAETDQYELYYNETMTEEHEFFAIRVKDDCIKYPLLNNLIVSFDLGTHAFGIEKLYDTEAKDSGEYIVHFLYDEIGYIWIHNHKGEVYRIKNNRVSSIEFPQEYISNHKSIDHDIQYMISEMLYREGNIYFILANVDGHHMLKYVISDKTFEKIEAAQGQHSERKEIRFDNCKMSGNVLLIYRFDNNMFYRWDFEEGYLNEFAITMSGSLAAGIQIDFCGAESTCTNLLFYFDYVRALDNRNIKNKNLVGKTIGKTVYCSSTSSS